MMGNNTNDKQSLGVPMLRFPEFEGEWVHNSLGKISEKKISYGIVQTGPFISGGIPCIRVVDLTNGAIIMNKLITTTNEISNSYKKTILVENELMIALRGEIGLTKVVDESLVGCNLTRGIARVSPNKTLVNSSFLAMFLNSNKLKKVFDRRKNGSALKEIPIGELVKIPIKYPSLPEQIKIATFLSTVDRRLQLLQKKKSELEQYKKGVMQKLFRPVEAHGRAPLHQTIRFKDENGNDFPDWEEKRLGEVCEMTSSKRVYLSDYVDEGIPFYRGKEITELKQGKIPSDILFISEERYSEYKSKYGIPQQNDILITAVGTLGNVYKVRDNKKFYFKDGNLIWLRKIGEDPNFLEILIGYNTNNLIKTSIGSTQKALTMVELKKLKFVFPSLPEQTKIANFLSSLDQQIEKVGKQIEASQQWKKGLLQKMFV